MHFELFSRPWMVNTLIFIPFIAFYIWRKNGPLAIPTRTLFTATIFGIAFGFVEAAVVVYLRAAVGMLHGYEGTLTQVYELSSDVYQQAGILEILPSSLQAIEVIREAATIIMLAMIAILSVKKRRERWALFFWTFAVWDIFYYVWLYATVGWPSSLLSPDVLFLIPVPWYSQVWYPVVASIFTIGVVLYSNCFATELSQWKKC